ncbi:MAG: hypothetical protein HRF43_17720 [Phycisphaerae bacterium]|jgi:UDP-N-acetylglucosamine transferase subunit ALG13
MIFVTVGAQMPFDRLIQAVDRWAGRTGRDDVFAQIGRSDYRPRHIRWEAFLDEAAFTQQVKRARALVAHAGIGSIFAALQHGKPIVVMPRRAALGETRNEHQSATARYFREMGIAVAADEHELPALLDKLDTLTCGVRIGPDASPRLIETLRNFIEGAAPSRARVEVPET